MTFTVLIYFQRTKSEIFDGINVSINTFETELHMSIADAVMTIHNGGWPQRPIVKFANIALLKIANQSMSLTLL